MNRKINLLLLGASRVVGLLERFHSAAKSFGVALEIWNFADDKVWHPVDAAGVAKSVSAPSFQSDEFRGCIREFLKAHQIDIVIPFVDSATVALAAIKPTLVDTGVLSMVSSYEACEAMADKALAGIVFKELGLRVPPSHRFPLLAKPRFGSSGRGIVTLKNLTDLRRWREENQPSDFVLQSRIEGTEYSVDAYVDGSGRVVGAVSRVREVVSDGEAMVTRTEHNGEALGLADALMKWRGWRGPLTIQVMYDGKQGWLLECNPRFGSGATCSIEAGLAMPHWILRERLGLPLPTGRVSWRDGLCMTRARKDYFLWLS